MLCPYCDPSHPCVKCVEAAKQLAEQKEKVNNQMDELEFKNRLGGLTKEALRERINGFYDLIKTADSIGMGGTSFQKHLADKFDKLCKEYVERFVR